MVKEFDRPKEPAAKRAERRWKNHGVATRFKAKKAEAKAAPPTPGLDPGALIIETEKTKADSVTRFQNKFLRSIKEMMEGHKLRNVELHLAVINHQRRKLLKEKLRRLENGTWDRGGQNG